MTEQNTNISPDSVRNGEDPRQVYLLNCLELVTIIFRGVREDECLAVFEDAVPVLATLSDPALQSLALKVSTIQESFNAYGSRNAPCAELESDYVRLFINSRDGISAPLYESCYSSVSPRVMGEPALAMRKRLEDADLKPAGSLAAEPPDHLCIELEYLYVLLARAWGGGDASALDEAVSFAENMIPWISRFREALSSADTVKLYLRTADLLGAVLVELAEVR